MKFNVSNAFRLREPASTLFSFVTLSFAVLALMSCAQGDLPGARNPNIPSPAIAKQRQEAINEKPDSVLYLPLGSDVLVPEAIGAQGLPGDIVGPFELRSETVAGALQLVMSDYEIPLAFETEEGLTRTVTVANLRGPMDRVVSRICSLADLYCAFEDGLLVVKETQTFMVTIPPIGEDGEVLEAVATGIEAVVGAAPITESATRTIIYEATNRTSELAERYFQRLRSSTALIVFEIYIWEVDLNSENATGINWSRIEDYSKFNFGIDFPADSNFDDLGTPVSIGLPSTDPRTAVSDGEVFQFLSTYGAVKTISQPQLTVLSGSEATLRAADTRNYVSSVSRSVDDGEVTVSAETDSVDTGFTLTVSSAWDNATIYGNISIELQEVRSIDTFTFDGSNDATSGESSRVQLPQTTERELSTQIRIRPGDSLLIGGLVRESDTVDSKGPGFTEPLIPNARNTATTNRELVFFMKPRVVVYISDEMEGAARGASVVKSSRARGAIGQEEKSVRDDRPAQEPITEIPLDLLNPSAF